MAFFAIKGMINMNLTEEQGDSEAEPKGKRTLSASQEKDLDEAAKKFARTKGGK